MALSLPPEGLTVNFQGNYYIETYPVHSCTNHWFYKNTIKYLHLCCVQNALIVDDAKDLVSTGSLNIVGQLDLLLKNYLKACCVLYDKRMIP